MGTVDKELADKIVKYNGYINEDSSNEFGDNPRCVMIIEYDNVYGGVGYGLTFEGRVNPYTESFYVINPRCYWKYKGEV